MWNKDAEINPQFNFFPSVMKAIVSPQPLQWLIKFKKQSGQASWFAGNYSQAPWQQLPIISNVLALQIK